jgi:hypothetical protein
MRSPWFVLSSRLSYRGLNRNPTRSAPGHGDSKVGVSDAANVDEVAAHIGSLRDLRELTFYRTGLSVGALSYLANLVSLKELWIDGSGFTSAGLAHLSAMSALEDLYIRDARGLDLAAFTCIARAPGLRKLTLRGGSFCDADLAPLAALVNLEQLCSSECNEVHGTFCKYLIGLRRLRRLSLGEIGGQVTDEGLASIAELSSLNELSLTGHFTDTGLGHLIALQNLTSLAIESEHVTAKGVSVVAQLPKLDHLYLDTPRLTDEGVAALLGCSMLETMRFRRSFTTFVVGFEFDCEARRFRGLGAKAERAGDPVAIFGFGFDFTKALSTGRDVGYIRGIASCRARRMLLVGRPFVFVLRYLRRVGVEQAPAARDPAE